MAAAAVQVEPTTSAFARIAPESLRVRRALCNLFSNLYKDKGLSGKRKIHESLNASTTTQTRLAGISSRPDIKKGRPNTFLFPLFLFFFLCFSFLF